MVISAACRAQSWRIATDRHQCHRTVRVTEKEEQTLQTLLSWSIIPFIKTGPTCSDKCHKTKSYKSLSTHPDRNTNHLTQPQLLGPGEKQKWWERQGEEKFKKVTLTSPSRIAAQFSPNLHQDFKVPVGMPPPKEAVHRMIQSRMQCRHGNCIWINYRRLADLI